MPKEFMWGFAAHTSKGYASGLSPKG